MGCVGTIDNSVASGIKVANINNQQQNSKEQAKDRIKRINVSCINIQKYSPFEYILDDHIIEHRGSDQLSLLENHWNFQKAVQNYPYRLGFRQKKYKQNLLILHRETINLRYSPLSNQFVGLKMKPQNFQKYNSSNGEQQKQVNQSKFSNLSELHNNKNISLMNTKQFCEKWDSEFQLMFKYSKAIQEFQEYLAECYKDSFYYYNYEEMKKDLKQFDLICYHALLISSLQVLNSKYKSNVESKIDFGKTSPSKIVNQKSKMREEGSEQNRQVFELPMMSTFYQKMETYQRQQQFLKKQNFMTRQSMDDLDNLSQICESRIYIWMMKYIFSKPILSLKMRISKLAKYIKKKSIDVMFLQNMSTEDFQELKQQLQDHRIVRYQGSQSGILVHRELITSLENGIDNLTLFGHNARYVGLSGAEQNPQQHSSMIKKTSLKQDSNKKTMTNFSKKKPKKDTVIQDLDFLLSKSNRFQKQQKFLKLRQQQQKQEADLKKKVMHLRIVHSAQQRNSQLRQTNIEDQPQFKLKLNNLTNAICDKFMKDMEFNQKSQNKNNVKNQKKVKKVKKNQKKNPDDEVYNNETNTIYFTRETLQRKLEIFNDNVFRSNVIQFIGCLILISAEIKTDLNSTVAQMKQKLKMLQKQFPNHTIIVGVSTHERVNKNNLKIVDKMRQFRKADENQTNQSQKDQKFWFAPEIYDSVPGLFFQDRCSIDRKKLRNLVMKNGFYTTSRHKTNFHLLKQERRQKYSGADSFIISNKQLQSYSIQSCDETLSFNKDFCKQGHIIPSMSHPFTEYFVTATLQFQRKTVFIANQQKNLNQLKQEN